MAKSLSFSLIICFIFGLVPGIWAQQQSPLTFTDARKLTLIGKAWNDGPFYHRLDTAAYPAIPRNVKYLATNSAGLAISFKTNSSKITAKWCTSRRVPGDNMTGIAFEGMDLYIRRDQRWQYAGVARPKTHDCSDAVIVEQMASGEKTCLLFLPTYDETISLEIGVDSGATLVPGGNPFRKNILVYGSSIVQGASASRPGLAYPARISRETGYNFINLGFSGNGKMEPEVANMIAPLPMDAFILDCVPNPSAEEVLARTANLVNTIRKFHPKVPIIAIESVAREKGNFDQDVAARVAQKNGYFKQEIEKLQKRDSNLYLISADGLLGDDQEGTTDGIHPNDLGFDRMLQKIRPVILKIFARYGI
ncbi:SGNH/GDSL hydrolase family protein [Pararcticibacter amylolyticus]|uniref:Hydrolase n=1 Tax=Pararcticibacter amylolyticus TaxID=2173175 RepID=A0A2U2PAA3_9SPHI|nr:SGNH/GDSL hydrolase family protein [Pararcticibacter amylolyticus]PWG78303.1 hydrolase [Pararcticibacter amylolyticus]